MSRKRYISTDISRDSAVNRMAEKYGDFAALLYTWMIPHAEDDACIRGDVEELMADVIPRMKEKTVEDVEYALVAMVEFDLIQWDVDDNIIYFPVSSFYKHQKYIKENRRRSSDAVVLRNSAKFLEVLRKAQNYAEVRGSSAKFLASLTHTHTHSHSHSHTQSKDKDSGGVFEPKILIQKRFETTFGRFPNEIQLDKLVKFVEQGTEIELVYQALEKTRIKGKDLDYAIGILNNQSDRGIKTVVQAEFDNNQRQIASTKHVNSPIPRGPFIPDDVPDEIKELMAHMEGEKIESQ